MDIRLQKGLKMESVEYLGFLIEVVSTKTGTYEYSVFDMTGKDKPKFSVFETDDVEFVSYEAAVDDAKSWIRDFLFNDDDRAVEHIEKLYATKKALSGLPSVETTGRLLQKLTADVFSRPDCPAWAKFASVDKCNDAYWFETEPEKEGTTYWWSANLLEKIPGKFDASDWQNSLIGRPVFKKLTADVFNRPDCPEWATFAAVDKDGMLFYFSNKPLSHTASGHWMMHRFVKYVFVAEEKFDSTDWKNSLIERPEKKETLPDWCKVDAVGWHKRCGYFTVTYIDDFSERVDIQQVEDKSKGYLSFHTVCNEVVQARLRPWTFEEAPFMVKAKDKNGKIELLRLHVEDSGNFFFRYHGYKF
jgi:hypothetical protein